MNSVLTKSKARKEEEDVNLDQEADAETIVMEFDFDDTLFEQTRERPDVSRGKNFPGFFPIQLGNSSMKYQWTELSARRAENGRQPKRSMEGS